MSRFVEGVEGGVEGNVESQTRVNAGMLRVLKVMRAYVHAIVTCCNLHINFISCTRNTLNTPNTLNIKKYFMKKQIVMIKKMLRVTKIYLQHPQHGEIF